MRMEPLGPAASRIARLSGWNAWLGVDARPARARFGRTRARRSANHEARLQAYDFGRTVRTLEHPQQELCGSHSQVVMENVYCGERRAQSVHERHVIETSHGHVIGAAHP